MKKIKQDIRNILKIKMSDKELESIILKVLERDLKEFDKMVNPETFGLDKK